MTKNTNTNTIKNEPIITDKKFPNEFETSSNIWAKPPSPISAVRADKTLKPNEKKIIIITGIKTLKSKTIKE